MTTTNKPIHSFRACRREHTLSLQAVADAAELSPTDVYRFEIGAILDRPTREKIVATLSQLTGKSYALSHPAWSSILVENIIPELAKEEVKRV